MRLPFLGPAGPVFLLLSALAVSQTGTIAVVKDSSSIFSTINPTTGVVTDHNIGGYLPGSAAVARSVLFESSSQVQRRWLVGGDGFIGRVTLSAILGGTSYTVLATGPFTARLIGRKPTGEVFFVDPVSDQVLEMSTAGVVTNVTSGPQPWGTRLENGALHPVSGEIFVGTHSDAGPGQPFVPSRIYRFLPGVTAPSIFGPSSGFLSPTRVVALAFDPSTSKLLAAVEHSVTALSDRLIRVHVSGVVQEVLIPASFNTTSLAIDQNGDFFTTSPSASNVFRHINPSGVSNLTLSVTNPPAPAAIQDIAIQGSLQPSSAEPLLAVTAPATGAVDVRVFNFHGGNTFRALVSLAIQTPTGTGPLFGVGGDALPQVFAPAIFGPIGAAGTGSVGFTGIPPGISADIVALDVTPAFGLDGASNVIHFTTQ